LYDTTIGNTNGRGGHDEVDGRGHGGPRARDKEESEVNEKARERATAALIEMGWEPIPAPQGYGDWARGQVWGRSADGRYEIRVFGARGWSTWRGEINPSGEWEYPLPFGAGEIPRPDEVLDFAEADALDAQNRLHVFEEAEAVTTG
jgi:hypothetical protein